MELSLNFNHTLVSRAVAVNDLVVTSTGGGSGVWKNSGAGTVAGANLTVPMALFSGAGSGTIGTLTNPGGATVTDNSSNVLVIPTMAGIGISH